MGNMCIHLFRNLVFRETAHVISHRDMIVLRFSVSRSGSLMSLRAFSRSALLHRLVDWVDSSHRPPTDPPKGIPVPSSELPGWSQANVCSLFLIDSTDQSLGQFSQSGTPGPSSTFLPSKRGPPGGGVLRASVDWRGNQVCNLSRCSLFKMFSRHRCVACLHRASSSSSDHTSFLVGRLASLSAFISAGCRW